MCAGRAQQQHGNASAFPHSSSAVRCPLPSAAPLPAQDDDTLLGRRQDVGRQSRFVHASQKAAFAGGDQPSRKPSALEVFVPAVVAWPIPYQTGSAGQATRGAETNHDLTSKQDHPDRGHSVNS